MVDIGEDTNTKRSINAISGPSISTNLLANNKWFGHICYMYEKDTKKFMHLQWYQHGSKILLQETAHPQALFLTDECDDVLIESIYQKANLRVLGSTEEEPPVAPDTEENSFYTGFAMNSVPRLLSLTRKWCLQIEVGQAEPRVLRTDRGKKATSSSVLQMREALRIMWTKTFAEGASALDSQGRCSPAGRRSLSHSRLRLHPTCNTEN